MMIVTQWLTQDWKTLLPVPWAVTALMFMAILSGAVVGTERQRKEKPAGLRTLILVCMGAAAFTLISFSFGANKGDAGRVVAQIITGIGFLGAGVILHGRGTISGTTTAATIWVTAAAGMAAGAGYGPAALGLSVLVRIVLSGIARYEVHVLGGLKRIVALLDYDPNDGKTRVHLERILADYLAASIKTEWSHVEKDRDRLTLQMHLPQMHLHELLDDMASVPEVLSIEQNPPTQQVGEQEII
jgi:putative Mg2+ transporter-C (MgtC) family protein